ncbi:hypothetical protein [Roseospirillum parvum]|uniref:Uncharacterized protein n=1 Tax=Roseospirillum parvum TaxID=83401 RepID=A0A1G7Y179_9PROT|nr:hypothetical protein [Roseospirillum parvum]SDG90113.1 hypothetical protein SAMN05421742_103158 [Roseospirillum parvum]
MPMMRHPLSALTTSSLATSMSLATLLLGAPPVLAEPPVFQPDAETCRVLRARFPETATVPAETVPDATYRPGVDAYGRAVVPAEGPGGADPLTESLSGPLRFPLTVDPLAWQAALGATIPPGLEGQLALGTLVLDPTDGALTLNGEPLNAAARQRLLAACRKGDAPGPE